MKAYAVREATTSPLTVFVIYKDLNASGKVLVTPSDRMGDAALLVVRATSLDSKAVTYGGVAFDNNTSLLGGTPISTKIRSDESGRYSISLENSSIAILTITP